mgnify:FL=1
MARKSQPYSSVSQFAEVHQLILPRPFDWRLIQDPMTGEVQGISSFRGFAIATNGIMVAIESERSDIAFGHLDYFIPDVEECSPASTSTKTPKTKKAPKHDISEYL